MSKLIIGINDLLTVNPELAAEWHPEKNGVLTPFDVSPGSGKFAWWLGRCGHEWQARIDTRHRGTKCPVCSSGGRKVLNSGNDLLTVNPELAAEWHPEKNGNLTPSDVGPGSGKIVWWLGSCGHEWQASINNRFKGSGCPICAGRKVIAGINDLATLKPELAAEWHPEKNGDLTPSDVSIGTQKNVWWLGKCGHEWQARILTRHRGAKCPVCKANKKEYKKII